MTRTLAALLLSAAPAFAAPVTTWDGPGENPCAGACTFAWYEAQIPEEVAALWRKAREARWAPERIDVQTGDRLAMMSYARDGRPYIVARDLVADVATPQTGYGWWIGPHVAIVQIDGCDNLVILYRDTVPPTYRGPSETAQGGVMAFLLPSQPSVAQAASGASAEAWGGWSWSSSSVTHVHGPGCGCCCGPVDPHEPPVAPIPLPAGVLLLGAALLGMWRVKG